MAPFSLRLRGPSCPSWITEPLVTVDPDAQKPIHQEHYGFAALCDMKQGILSRTLRRKCSLNSYYKLSTKN